MFVMWLLSCGGTGSIPATFDPSAFADLGFLVGQWRGAAPGEPVFFETYERASDTLIRILYHPDSTLAAARDTGSVFYSDGGIYHASGDGVWRLRRRDGDGFHFDPWDNATNAFTWRAGSDNAWRTVLHFSDGTDLVYNLVPVTR